MENIYGLNNSLVFNELSSILVIYMAALGVVIRKYSSKYMRDEVIDREDGNLYIYEIYWRLVKYFFPYPVWYYLFDII